MIAKYNALEDLSDKDIEEIDSLGEAKELCRQLLSAMLNEAAAVDEITDTATRLEDELRSLEDERIAEGILAEELEMSKYEHHGLLAQIEDVRRGIADFSELPRWNDA